RYSDVTSRAPEAHGLISVSIHSDARTPGTHRRSHRRRRRTPRGARAGFALSACAARDVRQAGGAARRAQPQIIDKISRPAEQVLQWWQYRQIFLTDKRISAGVEFWEEHRDTLERVSAEQGVPPQYIVAILGAETYYGHITGSYRVLD